MILKVDGLPDDLLERYVKETGGPGRDGHSRLPWIQHVFAQNGVWMDNFYARGLSLSAPSWSLLDTGRHLQIRGNVEYDRYTLRVYDYLNFLSFYFGYPISRHIDMPGVELLDETGIPLLIDRFPYEQRFQSLQLLQRGLRLNSFPGALKRAVAASSPRDFLDEWQLGLPWADSVFRQTEAELIRDLQNPQIRYLDYFTGDYDHVAHLTADPVSQLHALENLDALVGRVWNAIAASPLAAHTALVLVSDHGMNTSPTVFSQGFNFVDWFNSPAGGAHHVLTNRHPLTEFKLKGLDPFVSEVITPSPDSNYLAGQADQYPTVMLDLDGNERANIGLRNNTFNVLQILLDQLLQKGLPGPVRNAALTALFSTLDKVRVEWSRDLDDLSAELTALDTRIEAQQKLVDAQPKKKKWTKDQISLGLDKAARRDVVQLTSWRAERNAYAEYVAIIRRLLDLKPADFDPGEFKITELIPPKSLGPLNSLWDLRHYVTGRAPGGLVLRAGRIARLGPELPNRGLFLRAALDFGAQQRPAGSGAEAGGLHRRANPRSQCGPGLARRRAPGSDPRPRRRTSLPAGEREPRTCSVDAGLAAGVTRRSAAQNPVGRPRDLAKSMARRAHVAGSSASHALFERHHRPDRGIAGPSHTRVLDPLPPAQARSAAHGSLVLANDHWNFNVRGFNPGGNHGSFLRISTHSVLLFAGGKDTGIPAGLRIETPYDSLSFVPTILI